MNRISVRGVAVASATAVTAVGAVVGVAHGAPASAATAPDVAGSTLLADVPSGVEAQTVSDDISMQANAQQAAATAAQQKAADQAARVAAANAATAKSNAEKAEAAKAAAIARVKAAAQAAAQANAQAAAAREAAASTQLAQTYAPGSVQSMAESIIGNATQFQCFSNIVTRESGWDYTATNASSGAYGLVQALPGSKMASAGADWRTDPATQIRWGLGYMDSRYGSPCGAWSFWQANSWY
ncbi:lytic transglycosylase domain-containing protein [Streptacidiphilus sp. P02-A3a]|uniref:aggregation-promoting factor C-terminal-like domain-containing protein n=1 Tax=Streptacidiphilus sp. P02-A3a TaxID=2704468 RepID=UPI0015FBE856|nr:lytic transglycosylase domain-containing protein [Streptacidiphilus sp. P02-A3a]QMU67670.1 lytic transglycosylase domain-containing protein [Streptacidiphilus sp. P02-A3a]